MYPKSFETRVLRKSKAKTRIGRRGRVLAGDLARWLLDQCELNCGLDFDDGALMLEIRTIFGDEHICENEHGILRLSQDAMNAFQDISQEKVKWSKDHKSCWMEELTMLTMNKNAKK